MCGPVVLEDLEVKILQGLRKDPAKIEMLPVDIWVNILLYCEQQEDYEFCAILKSIESKVVIKTTMEFLDEFSEIR